MSVYNSQAHVSEAVESILDQTYDDFEFIILNDGSTDDTLAILNEYAARDSRIRILSRENRGLVFSLNQLIAEARAPIIARMDADDVALPDRFAKQIEFLEANPDYGVVGACAERIDDRGRLLPQRSIRCPTSHAAFVGAIGRGPLLVHSSVMYRKAVVDEAGGYNPAFRHCEDLGLWLRLAPRTKICSLPDELVKYRTWQTQVSQRHLVEQAVNAAILIEAWRRREAGKSDPTHEVRALPRVAELDRFFGDVGVEKAVLRRVVPQLLFCQRALTIEGAELIARHLDLGGDRKGLWRAVARLMLRFGEWRAGLELAARLFKAAAQSRRRRWFVTPTLPALSQETA